MNRHKRKKLLARVRKSRPARQQGRRRNQAPERRSPSQPQPQARRRRMTPEARLRFEHPSEPMPRMQLVEYPQSYDDDGYGWPDDEPAWPEDDERSWLEDEYDIDLPYEEQEGWGDAIEVGRAVQVRSRSGTRAAVAEVRPGLFLVGVMPEAVAVGAEARAGGVVDLTASMISQVVKAIQTAVAKGKAKRQAKLAALNAPPGPAAAPALAVPTPAAAGVGCSGRCRCGRR